MFPSLEFAQGKAWFFSTFPSLFVCVCCTRLLDKRHVYVLLSFSLRTHVCISREKNEWMNSFYLLSFLHRPVRLRWPKNHLRIFIVFFILNHFSFFFFFCFLFDATAESRREERRDDHLYNEGIRERERDDDEGRAFLLFSPLSRSISLCIIRQCFSSFRFFSRLIVSISSSISFYM